MFSRSSSQMEDIDIDLSRGYTVRTALTSATIRALNAAHPRLMRRKLDTVSAFRQVMHGGRARSIPARHLSAFHRDVSRPQLLPRISQKSGFAETILPCRSYSRPVRQRGVLLAGNPVHEELLIKGFAFTLLILARRYAPGPRRDFSPGRHETTPRTITGCDHDDFPITNIISMTRDFQFRAERTLFSRTQPGADGSSTSFRAQVPHVRAISTDTPGARPYLLYDSDMFGVLRSL